MPYNVPYRGDKVGTKVRILEEIPTYKSYSDRSEVLWYLFPGTKTDPADYMIVSQVDADPQTSGAKQMLVIADRDKMTYIIARNDSGTLYKYLINPIYYVLGGLVVVGLWFAFKKRKKIFHG